MHAALGQRQLAFWRAQEVVGVLGGVGDEQRRRSAAPMSSLAARTSRRAMNSGSSPPSNIRASQYSAASGSEPRIDLCRAEMML